MRAEINVLGTFEATIDGVSIVPTAAKPRHLLAVLSLNVGRVVTAGALIEELWGDGAPRSAHSTLQTYVMQLRKVIADAMPDADKLACRRVLETRQTGYVLRLDQDVLDVDRYLRRAAAGRTAGTAGDYEAAERLLRQALSVWRGPLLVDVSIGPHLEIEATRLSESRLVDLALRMDADLYLGRHHQLLGDLAALCARHPHMENFRAQYMLALYRCGRPGQALEVYHEMWTTIRDQFGVDPSPRLRMLHQAMLAGDPAIEDPKFVVQKWGSYAAAR
ncbi:AfsR/SARP family transcriptional regulator [Actinophytocola glycyrrhizae]|uniref:BTAD domain-containing putative transcriptional regulator n=1 Tax=Actinophytocola glycyrrhizae TaxID=2044873 RepID=A0ABV9S5K3_9PSEU